MAKKKTKNPPSPMTKNIVHRKPWKRSKAKGQESRVKSQERKCRIVLIEDEYE